MIVQAIQHLLSRGRPIRRRQAPAPQARIPEAEYDALTEVLDAFSGGHADAVLEDAAANVSRAVRTHLDALPPAHQPGYPGMDSER